MFSGRTFYLKGFKCGVKSFLVAICEGKPAGELFFAVFKHIT